MKVAKLTIAQKISLINQKFSEDSFFNPIQDLNGNWVISLQEIEQAKTPPYEWLKTLPLIDYNPQVTTL